MEISPTQQTLNGLEQARSDFSVSTEALQKAQLDSDAFLKLFLTQLENQDPLSPQDASALSAQLAQFSQLEQSIRSTDQLAGVNKRLDELIKSTAQRSHSSLDPVSLIGHSVDVGSNRLSLPPSGDSARLDMNVNAAGAEFLLLEALDANGTSVGVAVASRSNEEGRTLTLPHGDYQLSFRDGVPHVRFPDNELRALSFQPFTAEEGGNVVIRDGAANSFVPGEGYSFQAKVAGSLQGSGFTKPVTTTATGTVESVRMVEGLPVLRIAGQDIDPTQIIRIR